MDTGSSQEDRTLEQHSQPLGMSLQDRLIDPLGDLTSFFFFFLIYIFIFYKKKNICFFMLF